MSRRVVLRITQHTQNLKAYEDFFATARELGAGPRAKVLYQMHPEVGPVLVIELPASAAAALERKEAPPVLTKTQQAVRDRREARQKAIAAGEPVSGHEPPLARKGKLLIKKRKKK